MNLGFALGFGFGTGPAFRGMAGVARPILRAKKFVAIPGGTSATTIPLTSGWSASLGDGNANYAPVEKDVVVVTDVVAAAADVAIGVDTAGYAEEVEIYSNDNNDTNLSVSLKRMGATPDTSVDISQTTSALYGGGVIIEVWSRVNTVTALDVATTTATGIDGGRPNPPANTPLTDGAVILVCGGAAWTGDLLAAFTQSGSELEGFLSGVNLTATRDAAVGTGYYEWEEGAFDPVAWTGGTADVAASWAAAALVLRPA